MLRKVMEMAVTGTRPRGRPKKVCMNNIEEVLCELNLKKMMFMTEIERELTYNVKLTKGGQEDAQQRE